MRNITINIGTHQRKLGRSIVYGLRESTRNHKYALNKEAKFVQIKKKTGKKKLRLNPQLQKHIQECYEHIKPIGVKAPILVSQKVTTFTIQVIMIEQLHSNNQAKPWTSTRRNTINIRFFIVLKNMAVIYID